MSETMSDFHTVVSIEFLQDGISSNERKLKGLCITFPRSSLPFAVNGHPYEENFKKAQLQKKFECLGIRNTPLYIN